MTVTGEAGNVAVSPEAAARLVRAPPAVVAPGTTKADTDGAAGDVATVEVGKRTTI